jgi:hypothetical protein
MDEQDLALLTKLLDKDVELGEVVDLVDLFFFGAQSCVCLTEAT